MTVGLRDSPRVSCPPGQDDDIALLALRLDPPGQQLQVAAGRSKGGGQAVPSGSPVRWSLVGWVLVGSVVVAAPHG